MSDVMLAGIGRRLVGLLQRDFPVVEEPYMALAGRFGTDESEVMSAIARMKAEGLVRQISPVVDARRAGYRSTLVAMDVSSAVMERAAEIIAAHPGVSHAYERNHRFNLWFTLSLPDDADVNDEMERIRRQCGAEIAFSLPALRLFKIGAYFDLEGEPPVSAVLPDALLPQRVELSQVERTVVNVLQQDLALKSRPFDDMAKRAGMQTGEFLKFCRILIDRGLIRRYGASINHRKAGFRANAMVCWAAPPLLADSLGQALASLKEVSHCYERQTNTYWKYSIFAMVHGNTREACEAVVRGVVERVGASDFMILYSTRELKKARITYRV